MSESGYRVTTPNGLSYYSEDFFERRRADGAFTNVVALQKVQRVAIADLKVGDSMYVDSTGPLYTVAQTTIPAGERMPDGTLQSDGLKCVTVLADADGNNIAYLHTWTPFGVLIPVADLDPAIANTPAPVRNG